MNEQLDLVEILKDCPNGIELYSPAFGVVKLQRVYKRLADYPISVKTEGDTHECFTSDGKYAKYASQGECLLFPSKEQRDWSKFRVPVKKFDPKTLKPFDKVLVEEWGKWTVDFFSYISTDSETPYYCIGHFADIIIPYNDETKHLVGTSDYPDEKYIWWVDN